MLRRGRPRLEAKTGHLDWHSMECVTPKLQAFLECGLRLHSNDRSAEWKLKWSAI